MSTALCTGQSALQRLPLMLCQAKCGNIVARPDLGNNGKTGHTGKVRSDRHERPRIKHQHGGGTCLSSRTSSSAIPLSLLSKGRRAMLMPRSRANTSMPCRCPFASEPVNTVLSAKVGTNAVLFGDSVARSFEVCFSLSPVSSRLTDKGKQGAAGAFGVRPSAPTHPGCAVDGVVNGQYIHTIPKAIAESYRFDRLSEESWCLRKRTSGKKGGNGPRCAFGHQLPRVVTKDLPRPSCRTFEGA